MRACRLWLMMIAVAGLSLGAAANTVTVTFTNSYSPLGGPVQGVYYYPYVISLNNSTNTMNVACDDYYDEIYIHNPGEAWTATVNTFNTSGVISGGEFTTGGTHPVTNANQDYQQAAWLFMHLPNVSTQVNAAINFAIWDIFDPHAQTLNASDSTSDTSSTYWLNQAAGVDMSKVDFSDIKFFTPVAGSWNSTEFKNAPQELIGETPEPSTWGLLLTGMLALAGLAWRRRHLQEQTQS